ncbi:kinase-like domain-containing protein [Pavlovales sp. CCMP2436]|nr:kinase-like domain-containing protein [Pavlovales sp. CCMP2436]
MSPKERHQAALEVRLHSELSHPNIYYIIFTPASYGKIIYNTCIYIYMYIHIYIYSYPKKRHQAALEVRLLSELSHPNIIAYYGTVFNKRRQVLEIYMEYAESGTLADLIIERHNLGHAGIEEQTVMRWTRQMISALRCVHKRKIIHRDLKPSNVFVTKDGTVKLADFGISAELSTTEQEAQTVCGTPFYLSPEMVSGKPYTAATDVWSLGCILWELITLRRPFSGSNIMQLAMQIMSKEVDETLLQAVGVDARLRSMVCRMLSKDPAQRPTTASDEESPLATVASAPASDATLDAAKAVQAAARGWRDRQVVHFLRSISGPDEASSNTPRAPPPQQPQQPRARVPPGIIVPPDGLLRAQPSPVRSPAGAAAAQRGGRAFTLPPPEILVAELGGTPRSTPRGTPRVPLSIDRLNPPSSAVSLPAVGGSGSGYSSSGGGYSLSSLRGALESSRPATPSGLATAPAGFGSSSKSSSPLRSPTLRSPTKTVDARRRTFCSQLNGSRNETPPLPLSRPSSGSRPGASTSGVRRPKLASFSSWFGGGVGARGGGARGSGGCGGSAPASPSAPSSPADQSPIALMTFQPVGATADEGEAERGGASCAMLPVEAGRPASGRVRPPGLNPATVRVHDAEAKRTSVRLRPELRLGWEEKHKSPMRSRSVSGVTSKHISALLPPDAGSTFVSAVTTEPILPLAGPSKAR